MSLKGSIYTLALGAGLMYLFDPERGRRRRALLEEQVGRVGRDLEVGFERACRDLNNRLNGAFWELSGYLHKEQVAPEVLEQRIRSKIGRLVSRPRGVEVSVQDGSNVVLRGSVGQNEIQPLIAGLRRLRGVRHVRNELQTQQAEGEDQEARPTRGSRRNLAPGERLLTGGLGTSLLLSALTRVGVRGALYAAAGVSLLNRSLSERSAESSSERWSEEESERGLPH